MKAKGYFERALKGLNWALFGLIISSILIIVYVYNIDPASIIVGNPYEPVTVKTFFGDKMIYPRLEETPRAYTYLNLWGYTAMALLIIVNIKPIIKDVEKLSNKLERYLNESEKIKQEDRKEQKKD